MAFCGKSLESEPYWHLPHAMKNLNIQIEDLNVKVRLGGNEALNFFTRQDSLSLAFLPRNHSKDCAQRIRN